MLTIKKILGALLMRHSLIDSTPLFYNMFSNIVALLALIIIITIMMGAMFFGLLFIIYCDLINNGVSQFSAISAVLSIIFLFTCAFVYKLSCRYKRVKIYLSKIIVAQSPITNKATSLLQSFVDGLFNNPQEKL